MAQKVIDISDIQKSGNLNGKVTGLVWTGYPLREVIGNFNISYDLFLDNEYKQLLSDLEVAIIK